MHMREILSVTSHTRVVILIILRSPASVTYTAELCQTAALTRTRVHAHFPSSCGDEGESLLQDPNERATASALLHQISAATKFKAAVNIALATGATKRVVHMGSVAAVGGNRLSNYLTRKSHKPN